MTITAEQEQFINKHSEYADKVYERHANFQSTKRYMAVDEVRALVSQLVPAGHVVVPRDELSMILRSHKCEHEAELLAHRHLINICGVYKTMTMKPLPAPAAKEGD